LRAAGWRNLAPLELDLDPRARLTVFFGDNGQGKTNVLEALYYLGSLRSFRTSNTADLVQHGAAEARIAAEVEQRDLTRRIEAKIQVKVAADNGADDQNHGHAKVDARSRGGGGGGGAAGGTRTVFLDGKPVRRLGGALGVVRVVLFVPEDLLLPRGTPAARRRFLDFAVFGVEPAYLGEAAVFDKLLRSRNALLRQGRPRLTSALLDTYDEELARGRARVVVRRRRVTADLAPHLQTYFRALHADLPAGLAYLTAPELGAPVSESEVEQALLAGLRVRRPLDERRGHTTFGPQTDDVELRLDGRPARAHASQGQIRSLVLALKLAELGNVQAHLGDSPVLLLDDVPSELDPDRRGYLFETLAGLSCQTLISVADPAVVPAVPGRSDHLVRGGVVTPWSSPRPSS
jgi:DNA replication and repair protein RecF